MLPRNGSKKLITLPLQGFNQQFTQQNVGSTE